LHLKYESNNLFDIRATSKSLGFLSTVPWIWEPLHLLENRGHVSFLFCLSCAPSSSGCFLDSLTPGSYDIIISMTRKVNQPWKYDLITVSGRRCYVRNGRSLLQTPVLRWAFSIIFLPNFSENTFI